MIISFPSFNKKAMGVFEPAHGFGKNKKAVGGFDPPTA
jgi:hypothetical protein